MPSLSTQPNRAYPSIPNVDDSIESHTFAIQAIKDALTTHERRDNNFLKSFIRFEELVDLGIIDNSGDFILNLPNNPSNPGSTGTLGGLTDVDITNVQNDDIIQYNTITSMWENSQIVLPSHGHPWGDITGVPSFLLNISGELLGDLSNVEIEAFPQEFEFLVYDEPTATWINQTATELGISDNIGGEAEDGDMLYYDLNDGLYYPTEGALHWDVDGLFLQLSNDLGINWLDEGQVTREMLRLGTESIAVPISHQELTLLTGASTTSTSYVDVTGAFIDQSILVDNDDYLLLVMCHGWNDADHTAETNGIRMVNENGTLLSGSEQIYESLSGSSDTQALQYFYVNWLNADIATGTTKWQLQHKMAVGSGTDHTTSGIFMQAINISQIPNTQKSRTVATTIIDGENWVTIPASVTLPAGDWLIFCSAQHTSFNGNANPYLGLNDGTMDIGPLCARDIPNSTGRFSSGFVHHVSNTVTKTYTAIGQTGSAAGDADNIFTSLVAIRLEEFSEFHISRTAGDTVPADGNEFDLETLSFTAGTTSTDWMFLGAYQVNPVGSGPFSVSEVQVNIAGMGDMLASGDKTYTPRSESSAPKTGFMQIPGTVQTISSGQSIVADLRFTGDVGFPTDSIPNNSMLVAFPMSVGVSGATAFNVGHTGFETRLHGTVVRMDNNIAFDWLDPLGFNQEMLILTAGVAGDTEVELLADMEASDGATSYTELSSNAANMAFTANAQIDTAQFNSHSSSLLLDGVGDFGSFPDIAAYTLGTQAWTIEGFVRFNSLPTVGFTSDPGYTVAAIWGAAAADQMFNFEIIRDGFGTRVKLTVRGGSSEQGTISGGINLNQWYHWAVARDVGGDGNIRAYFNGIYETSDFGTAPTDMGNSTEPLRLGSKDGTDRYLDGWIDDVRFTIGTARYIGTGSQSIPSTPFSLPAAEPAVFIVGNIDFDTHILGPLTHIQSLATDIDGTLNVDGATTIQNTLDVEGPLTIAPVVTAEPILKWVDSNGAADNRAWRVIVDDAGLTWSLQAANDADTIFGDAMTVTRTFATISNVTFPRPVFFTDEAQFFDDNPLQFGTGFDISLIWDSTASALEVESASTNQTWVFRNGMHVTLTGVGNNETVDFHHDETDLNTVAVNTVDWNITGLTGGMVLGAGVNMTSDFHRTVTAITGGLEANNLETGAGFERVLTTSDITTGGASLAAAYRFDTSIVEADPGNGDFRMDNATPASVTEIFVSSTTDNGNDFNTILSLVSTDDQIYIQQDNDSTKFILLNVTANVDNTGWWSIAGTIASSGTVFDSNAKCHILILFDGNATFGDVFKVGTPVDGQVGVWTGDGTIEGDPQFTFDEATGFLHVASAASPGLGASQTMAYLLEQADGELIGVFGYGATPDFQITNLNHGGDIVINGEDAGGVPIPFVVFDTDNNRAKFDVNIYIKETPTKNFSYLQYGQFWVRDDAPNVPMYTNRNGTDFRLDADVFKVGTPVDNQVAIWTGDGTIEGDANFLYTHEYLQILVDTNLVNELGMLFIDTDSVLNPFGWNIVPGQAGIHDGTLIFSNDPTDVVNNRAMTILPGSKTIFGYGASVAADVSFGSESAGALAYFQPLDTTGREETKLSGVGFVGGTGHEGLLSFEVYGYGDSGLQFSRQLQLVLDADATIHADFYGTIRLGEFFEGPVEAGNNAAFGWTAVNGLEITGQGSTNDLVIFNDLHREVLSIPSSSGKVRIHYRFAASRYMQMEQNNTNFQMIGVNNINDFTITGLGGEFNVDSDATFQGDLVAVGFRPSGTVEWDKGADIASASALVLGSDGNYFDVTGTTTINSISAKPIGTIIVLQFDAALVVQDSAVALILENDVTYGAEPGDTLGLICYDGTNWREIFRTDPSRVRSSSNIADMAMVRGNGGAKRITGTGNLIGDDDEMIMAGTVILANFTDAQLNAIGNSVNTNAGKAAGAMVFNSTQGHAVTAQGSTAGSVWNDGVGTLTNTPV